MNHTLLRTMTQLLIAPIMVFALYVQFHGDFGPGGGFQAGVIFAAAVILYGIVFGIRAAKKAIPDGILRAMAAFGVLLYGGVGVATMLLGGRYLEYGVLAHDPVHGQHYGIILVELGVGIAVASVMILIFYAFASRGEPDDR
ncbi:MAG: Na(+)/H(+) antiporter subunit B [Pseudomonadales bacterium]|nr:Na(+)/H(+) antiporter subunit B [Pseudomonadales bacterium]